ncbi:MAG: family 16 glycosylhydrolase [Patescibacteria group bacterium]
MQFKDSLKHSFSRSVVICGIAVIFFSFSPARVMAVFTDAFDTPVSSGLESVANTNYALTNESRMNVSGGTANFNFAQCNSTIGFELLNLSDTSSDTTVSFNFKSLPASGEHFLFHTSRYQKVDLSYRLDIGVNSSGVGRMYWGKLINSTQTATFTPSIPLGTISANKNYKLRVVVTGTNPTTLRAKVWAENTTEPTGWMIDVTDSQAELQNAGKVGLRSYLGGTCTSSSSVLSFDNLRVDANISTPPTATPNGSPSSCTGDINQDQVVDLSDYSILAQNFFKVPPTNPRADINNDGQVDLTDYSILVSQFLMTCSSTGATSTPVKPSATGVSNPTATKTPSSTPTRTPTPAPSVTTAPTPTPGSTSGVDPSGEAMPVGDLPGWKQIMKENFSRNVDLGPGKFMSVYKDSFTRIYGDGEGDTAGKFEGKPSRYYPSKVMYVKNGVLIENVHTEGGTPMGTGLFVKMGSDPEGAQLYGKYTVRFRVYQNNSTSLKGFKMAWLLWPKSQQWPRDGEIDFPEGDFGDRIFAAHHRQNGSSGDDQDVYFSNTRFDDTQWHTASIEWLPNDTRFILDGKLLGNPKTRVPNTPMFWVIQTESCLSTACPNANANGNVEIDWITAYARVP